ncbi:hypothetical protein [Rhizorhapis sp. SPR117]|nr:hypothetical protein [Rhizorhapis sp. SPR117]
MSRKFIQVEESVAGWHKDPTYRSAYDALEKLAAATKLRVHFEPIGTNK